MNRFALLLTCALAAGCGPGMPATDPAAYQKLTQDSLAMVEMHRTNAAAMTMSTCTTEHDRYDAEMRPMIDSLKAKSGGMDTCMKDMGKPADADLAAGCTSMMAELDSHKTAACASMDLAAQKTEATRHCDAMKTWLDTAKARASYLQSPMQGMSSSCK
ncbi:MAG: hypothetical protein ACYC8T_18320 [Myxococcaceae bacterium]